MSSHLTHIHASDGVSPPLPDVRIREMTDSDCEAVAEIRVRGWQTAYAGLVPQAYLDAMSVEGETVLRRRTLAKTAGAVVNLVAERGGKVVGWACHGPSRDGEATTADAELHALYVHPSQLSTGVGRALIQHCMTRCRASGHAGLRLWALEGNARARRFYERAGLAPDGAREPFEADGVQVPEVRYSTRLA
ncbi:GNAT family N-acetyltransferase [Streptomyces sp. PSKA54]|uniref:GNAT family N-acetyltransferase n=1 Tax=Streptomyces himalayensis subsp. aureolus TaxID=2758039 RepID=A0A7W2CZD5_9ACTN|nr:GNAT family N-acetyltransferase [Streptomyces himalayensis]MBA4861942.1 GNAT family N-acetyltransferase [Streptomyces himalayensis subsp. aureolus]